MGFFFDEFFALEDGIDPKFDLADVRAALEAFKACYDPADEQKAYETAQRTREYHRTYEDFFQVDADIDRRLR